MKNYQRAGSLLLRSVVAILIIIHGLARIQLEMVDDFGVFLIENHIPFGEVLAWIITLVEVLGGILLGIGFFVVPLCGWFAFQLLVGMAFFSSEEGWFRIEAGQNGFEYSALLITALIVVLLWHITPRPYH